MASSPFAIAVSVKAEEPEKTGPSHPTVVDTHVHCFAGARNPRFPYHPHSPYQPEMPATPKFLLKCMDEVGIDFAVIIHPEPYQDDHKYLEYCLGVGKNRFKGTCLFFADQPGSLEKMPALVKEWPIVAIRVHAYAPDRLPPFGKPELRRLWRMATEYNLAVQIHLEPRYATGFEPLIKEFSGTRVIIDHLGRPFQGTPEEHERIVRWSDFKNTVLKLSALPLVTTYPHRDPTAIIKRLVVAYGAERIIYGGGFSGDATPKSYRATLDRTRALIGFLSAEDQAKIIGENAKQLFAFV